MKWFRTKIDRASSDNRGSTIIIVLVTMTFLTVLASVLLYLSLVNLQMKKIDKAGKANFYNAEAAMNEIRAGIQESVSEAIKDAYTDVLISYDEATKDAQIANFRTKFFDYLSAKPIFISSGQYDPAVLASFVSALPVNAAVSGSTIVEPIADGAGHTIAVVLKDVTVRYTLNGYETKVSSDIKIQAPILPYTETSSKQTAIPDFAIVSGGTLLQPAGSQNVSVSGNVCARNMVIGGSGDVFSVRNASYFVLGGPVTVNGGTLSFNSFSSLWAQDIKLDIGGQISIAGDAYIANDLNLFGGNTRATLSGRYYGFGSDPTHPDQSSSIIINGTHTVLDMSALSSLFLAGHSYVNYGTGDNGYIMMGESVSVKSNQIAYLVPDNCLASGITNPLQYKENEDPTNEFLQTKVLLDQKIMNNKTLYDYGITSTTDNIRYIRKTVGSTNLIYICLNFSTPEAANAYFKDYYNTNGSTILKYLTVYSDGISLWDSSTKNLAGEAFTFNGTTLGPIIEASDVPEASISEISSSYANLCVTLSRTESAVGSGASTAFDYFVNTSELSTLPEETMRYPADGPAKVIVTRANDFTLDMHDAGNSSVHIVISLHNVTVKGSFSGLILAGETVTVMDDGTSVKANRALVADALQALLTGSGDSRHYMYLNPQVISPMNVSTDLSGKSEIWNMNSLVIYENWAKNEE